MTRTILTFASAILFCSGAAFAQQSQPQTQPNHPDTSVAQRKQNQQGRIANGIDNGQLTTGESKNLESRETNVNREIKDDRAADDGHLTAQERAHVNAQQNNISKSIYNDKHNSDAAHYGNNQVGQRRENQQDRIANGLRNGKMNAGQAARDENREQGINRQVRADRAGNGGKLTNQERAHVNRRQNRMSRRIYRQKH